jgi:nitrogenase molybdenum-iron protein alpha/beta subunit
MRKVYSVDIPKPLILNIACYGTNPSCPTEGLVSDIADSANSLGTIAICRTAGSAATYLKNKFMCLLCLTQRPSESSHGQVRAEYLRCWFLIPEEIIRERGRLIDSMVDVHHYMFGRKVAIFGDPDLVRTKSELRQGWNHCGNDSHKAEGLCPGHFGSEQ